MTSWTVYRIDVPCGSCGVRMPAGEPVAYLTVSKKNRCASCIGEDVNWTEVENERWRLEDELRRQAASRIQRTDELNAGVPERVRTYQRPHRSPTPSRLVRRVFDPKAAAAGDR